MKRWAFRSTFLSNRYKFYYGANNLDISTKPRNELYTIVCAQHEHVHTLLKALKKC